MKKIRELKGRTYVHLHHENGTTHDVVFLSPVDCSGLDLNLGEGTRNIVGKGRTFRAAARRALANEKEARRKQFEAPPRAKRKKRAS